MAVQFVLFAAFVAVASAGVLAPAPLAAPLLQAAPIARVAAPLVAHAPVVAHAAVDADYDPNPQYSYAYDVQDGLTGDSKNQQESRSGDVVQGSYSLTDPDGTRRTVEYTADPVNGFNAVVHREPLVAKAVVAAAPVARVAAPVAVAPVARIAAPIARFAPAPLAYSAGLAHAPIAAPLGYAAAPLGYAGLAHAPIAAPLGYAASPYAKTIIH